MKEVDRGWLKGRFHIFELEEGSSIREDSDFGRRPNIDALMLFLVRWSMQPVVSARAHSSTR